MRWIGCEPPESSKEGSGPPGILKKDQLKDAWTKQLTYQSQMRREKGNVINTRKAANGSNSLLTREGNSGRSFIRNLPAHSCVCLPAAALRAASCEQIPLLHFYTLVELY